MSVAPQRRGKMQRMNIMLAKYKRQALDELARKENKSISCIVREKIDMGIRIRNRRELERAAEWLLEDHTFDK